MPPCRAAPRAPCAWTISARTLRRNCCGSRSRRRPAYPGFQLHPLVPAKAGTQGQELDSRFRGNEREVTSSQRIRMNAPKRKPRRANNESNRRDELLRASARLFREKGFDGTSIRDISTAAGMHSGSPFYHFKTKQDILVAVMEQGLAEGLHKTESVMALPLPPEQRLMKLIRAHLGTILEDGNDFIPVLLYDWRSLTSANRRRIVALKDRYDALWQQIG